MPVVSNIFKVFQLASYGAQLIEWAGSNFRGGEQEEFCVIDHSLEFKMLKCATRHCLVALTERLASFGETPQRNIYPRVPIDCKELKLANCRILRRMAKCAKRFRIIVFEVLGHSLYISRKWFQVDI